MDYCPHCMTRTTAPVCPSCGKATQWQAPANQLPVGTLLRSSGDRIYQLGAAKGQGGFGITYAAMDLRTNTRVAIKEYYPSHCAGRDTMTRVICSTGQQESFESGLRSFLQEAKTLSSVGALDSVVSVRDLFESNGTAYIVMEYVDGLALNQVVAARGRMYKQELFPILTPLLRDLGILHRAGVIHRDISPDNLILTKEGKLKLLDFGAARSTSGHKTMTVMLKAGFSPLEQYQSKGQGPYTDVYAMAGTIYYCLTGRVPPAAVDRIQTDELIAPNDLGVGLTQREQDALIWGLNVFAERRPQNVEAFANAMLSTPGAKVFEPPIRPENQYQTQQTQYNAQSQNNSQVQYQTQSQTGGKAGFGKGLAIGIGAAVVAVALLVTGLALGGAFDKKKGPSVKETEPTERVAAQATDPVMLPGQTQEKPAAEERPAAEDLVSEEGFAYRVENGEAIITGYVGPADDVLVFPDELGGCPVTVIGEGCIQGDATVECVLLPLDCTEIRANAFSGCINLTDIGCYSTPTADPSAFSGCTRLRCILVTEGDSVAGWTIPANCVVFNYEMETGKGALISVAVDSDGVIYGITDSEVAVIMDIPSGVTYLKVPEDISGWPVLWVHSGALDHASRDLTVYMCPDMGFDYSLLYEAEWDCDYLSDFCFSWYLTCGFCDDINKNRGSDAQIMPDWMTIQATTIRVREISTNYANTRDDGSSWSTVLDEVGIPWEYARTKNRKVDSAAADYDSQLDLILQEMMEAYYTTYDEEGTMPFTRLGVSVYATDDGIVYFNSIGVD